jgi:hypothetical protein
MKPYSGIRLSEIQTIVLPRLTYSLLQYTSFDCIPLYSVDLRKKIIETYEENNRPLA